MIECCKLVGNLDYIDLNGCITSINVSSSTEIIGACSPPELGPTVGNVSITGYAQYNIHKGCPVQAGTSVNWVRRYDCEEDKLYLIQSNYATAFMVGSSSSITYISLIGELTNYKVINASIGSGPTSLYTDDNRVDGYGLNYSGNILSVDTSQSLIYNNFGVGSGDMYLQSFNFNAQPGQVPTVSYSFLFTLSTGA
jgi:hypothetical protein